MCKIVFGILNFTAIFNRVDWNLVSLSQSFRCEPVPPVVLSNVCCKVFHFHQILISVVWLQRVMKFKKLVKLESLVRKTSHLCHFFIAENLMVPIFDLKLSYFRVLNTFVYQLKHIIWGKGWSLPRSLHHNYLTRLPLVSLPKTFFFQKKKMHITLLIGLLDLTWENHVRKLGPYMQLFKVSLDQLWWTIWELSCLREFEPVIIWLRVVDPVFTIHPHFSLSSVCLSIHLI